MRRALVAVALSALVAVAGCSLIFSVDRFEGDPSRADDAAKEGVDDALSDAAITDALPLPERWCLRDATFFCEDFDQTDGLSFAQWDPPQPKNGSLSLDDAAVRSAPYALLVSTRANADATATNVFLNHTFETSAAVNVAFDLLIDALPTEEVHVFELKLRDASGLRYGAYLLVSAMGTRLYESDAPAITGADASRTPLHPPLVAGKWTHVTIDLVYGRRLPDKPVLRVAFDDASPPVYEDAPFGGAKDDLSVLATFGVSSSSPKDAVMLHVDNIRIDTR